MYAPSPPLRRLRSLVALLALLHGCTRPAPGGAPVEPASSSATSAASAATVPAAPAAAGAPAPSAGPQGAAGAAATPAPAAPAPGAEFAVATGTQGAVSSAEGAASDVGVEILKKGGNAVDAAVAVGFALSVTHPTAGNIGGGGFMVVRLPDGSSTAIDYREMAPRAASRDMYLDASGQVTK